jgi:hypothetical protein
VDTAALILNCGADFELGKWGMRMLTNAQGSFE